MKKYLLLVLSLLTLGCTTQPKPIYTLNNDNQDIKGLTAIIGKSGYNPTKGYIIYLGPYRQGLWFDSAKDAHVYAKTNRTGFGIKADLNFGYIVRPVAKLYRKNFWTNSKVINSIPREDWNDYYGEEVATRLATNIDSGLVNGDKYSADNPWYGAYWFNLRIPKFVPSPFISISTPIKSFYIGNKSYNCSVPTGEVWTAKDSTWCNEKDKERALRNETADGVLYLCPSITLRTNRQ